MTIAYRDRGAIEAWDCAAMEISKQGAQAACEYFHVPPSNVKVVYDSETDGQAVLLRDPGSDTTVIAFRGSASTTNWLTNINFVSAKRDGMSIHAGFDDAAAALQPGILNYLQEHHGPASTLMVTGHSLGAALATLTAHNMRSRGHVTGPIALVSFASPRVGFGDFRAHFASLFPRGAWRVTRPDDAATNVPPFVPVLAPWVHVPGEIHFSQQNGPTRRCCNDASGEDDQCSGSSNQILETADQHLSKPYMVTGDHVVSIGCEGVALQCSAGSCEFPPSPPPADSCTRLNRKCNVDCGEPGSWSDVVDAGAIAQDGVCYSCWKTSLWSNCEAAFRVDGFTFDHCCNPYDCSVCQPPPPLPSLPPPSPPALPPSPPQLCRPSSCNVDCGQQGTWSDVVAAGATAQSGVCYNCWTTFNCPEAAFRVDGWTYDHCCDKYVCPVCSPS